jgi:hypothetical protein
VTIRRAYHEHQDVALERHFAAHPEDEDANVVIFHFFDDGMPGESQDRSTPGPAAEYKDRDP